MNRRILFSLLSLAILLIPAVLWAHPAHGHGHEHLNLWSGFLHPITGIDHLIAALVIGAWAFLGERVNWQIPAIFLGAMCLGALGTAAGLTFGAVGLLSSSTIVVLGLLLATATIWPRSVALLLVATVGLIHGGSHLAGLSVGGSELVIFMAALMLTTALLHAGGFLAASRWFKASKTTFFARAPQLTGAAVAIAGVVLLSVQLML